MCLRGANQKFRFHLQYECVDQTAYLSMLTIAIILLFLVSLT